MRSTLYDFALIDSQPHLPFRGSNACLTLLGVENLWQLKSVLTCEAQHFITGA